MARSKPSDATAPGGKAGRGPKDAGRGRPSGATASGKAPKLDKKGQPKVGRLKKLRGQAGMIKQAYTLTRKNDPKLPWIMLIAFVAVAGVIELIGILLGSPYLLLPPALIAGGVPAPGLFRPPPPSSAPPPGGGPPGAAAPG